MKISLISLLIIISSCTKFERYSFINDSKENRSVASANGPECYVDTIDLDYIKKEILELDEKITKVKLKVKEFRSLELSNGQKAFLNQHSTLLDQDSNLDECKDFYCLLNVNYKNDTLEEAYRIYYFYLKTGIGIDTSATRPEWNGGGFAFNKAEGEVSDYLFKQKELKSLNIASLIYPEKYRSLSVKSLHRTKDGEYIAEHGFSRTTGIFNSLTWNSGSGKYKSRSNLGYITISQQNLKIDKNISGDYVNTFVHEMTHALDYTFGIDNTLLDLSDQEDWYSLSWERADLSSNSTLESNLNIKAGSLNFLSNYSKETVAEDFAEHGAFFLTSPEKLKAVAKEKYKYFKKNIYSGKSFVLDEALEIEKSRVSDIIAAKSYAFIAGCDENTQVQYEGEHFLTSLPNSSQVRCLETLILEELAEVRKSFKKTNYLGCDLYDKYDDEIRSFAQDFIDKELEETLSRHSSFKELAQDMQSYTDDLILSCPADSFILEDLEINEKSYIENITFCADRLNTKLEPILKDEKIAAYLNKNKFNNVKALIEKEMGDDLVRFKIVGVEALKEIVNSCARSSGESRSLTPFNISYLPLNIGFNNCINSQSKILINDLLVKNFSKDISSFNSAFTVFQEKGFDILAIQLELLLNEVSSNESLEISNFPFEAYESELYRDSSESLDFSLTSRSDKYDACLIAFQDIIKQKYVEYFDKLNIKTHIASDYYNSQLQTFCNGASYLKKNSDASDYLKEKDVVNTLVSEYQALEAHLNNLDVFNVFKISDVHSLCIKESKNISSKFSDTPYTLNNTCLDFSANWDEKTLVPYMEKIQCKSSCKTVREVMSIDIELKKYILEYFNSKFDEAKSKCQSDTELTLCLKADFFNNDSKVALADGLDPYFDDRILTYAKKEFITHFFKMSLKRH